MELVRSGITQDIEQLKRMKEGEEEVDYQRAEENILRQLKRDYKAVGAATSEPYRTREESFR